jgi:hypothetical protein
VSQPGSIQAFEQTPLLSKIAGYVQNLKKLARSSKPGEEGAWQEITGSEEVVQGNLSGLQDGQSVRSAASP